MTIEDLKDLIYFCPFKLFKEPEETRATAQLKYINLQEIKKNRKRESFDIQFSDDSIALTDDL